MSRWQRRARLVIGIFAAIFVVVLTLAFGRHVPGPASTAVVRTDPSAVVESRGGNVERFRFEREDVHVGYERLLTYADGSSKLVGVTIVTDERGGARSFTVTGKEAKVGQAESTIALDGDVRLISSDGISARTEHATYSPGDGGVTAPGPVDFSRGRLTGKGVGLRYEKARDMLWILDQAVVHAAPDEKGAGAADITAGTAGFARRDKYIQLERGVRIRRGRQVTEAVTAVARLTQDEKRIESVELHDNARITEDGGAAGSLQSLVGHDMNLIYAAGGDTLEHALITGDALLKLAGGGAGRAGRQIAAKMLDILMAPDGSTPKSLTGHDGVQLTFPPEPGAPGRIISAAHLEATGESGQGLTRALFTGSVQFREHGAGADRAASSARLELMLQPGMSTIDEARFVHGVRFEEGKMAAQAAAARYDVNKGTLELSGSEPGSLVPRVVNEQIAVDAAKIDMTLEGPKVKAAGMVKSMLQPQKPGAERETKMPSMLKQDQPVAVLAEDLAYDGIESTASYKGAARLFQGDTTIKADTLVLDQKRGDMTGTGHVMTTTMREQTTKDKKTERAPSTATANDMKYQDAVRVLTYIGAAHMVGPEGDMSATKIELFLNQSGDDVERAEAYAEQDDKMTLREQNRTTTGIRMTYTAATETYIVGGLPAIVVDECARETTGKTLTMVKATDTIVVDGNQQVRTQTKGGAGKCP